MKKIQSKRITESAIIAALYIVLTVISKLLGIADGAIQLRLSEALTILPYFTVSGIWGLFLGCFISNFLIGSALLDVIFGSIATLIGAIGTYMLRKYKYLAPLPPILANILIIPPLLVFIYHVEGTLPLFMLTVGIGEFISCGILGMILLLAIEKNKKAIFK